ncbi:MAG: hypothetical protein V2A73_07460 [Pseudomonadota bacterium]
MSQATRNIEESIKKASDCLASQQRALARASAAFDKLDATMAEVDRRNEPVAAYQSEVWSKIEAGAALRKANAGLTKEAAIAVFLESDEGQALRTAYEEAEPDEPTVEKADASVESEKLWREILAGAEEWSVGRALTREQAVDQFMHTSKGQALRASYESAQRSEQAAARREQA